ncbi:MAG: response regulator [Rhodovibrionaceae bacterium]
MTNAPVAKPACLVVDDDSMVRDVIARTLSAAGYPVRTAGNGNEAVEIFSREPCAIVITDIVMPEKEGIETILELKRRDAAVKILAISGGGRERGKEFLRYASRLGANEVLPKPFRKAELLEVIARFEAEIGTTS